MTTPPANAEVGRTAFGPVERRSPLPHRGPGASRRLVSRADGTALSAGRNPHGVESGPTTGKGKLSEPGSPAAASFGMAEATGERDGGGRSSHSSQRTGKPSTRRRGAVQTASKQEGGEESPALVNTEAILNMQRKLYGHGEPDAWKQARPVRREGRGNLPPQGGKAPQPYSTRTRVWRWRIWPTWTLVAIDHFSRKVVASCPLEGPNAGWVVEALEEAFAASWIAQTPHHRSGESVHL